MLKCKYGEFSADGLEYYIKRPDTPRPWLNYMSNLKYGLCVSQVGYGFSWYLGEMYLKHTYIDINGYVPTHPQTGRFHYIHDQESGESWPTLPMDNAIFDKYKNFQSNAGQQYSTYTAERNGVKFDWRIFVPQTDDPLEVWTVTLTNTSKKTRKLAYMPYVQFMLSSWPVTFTDLFAFNKAWYNKKADAIVASQTNPQSCVQYGGFMAASYKSDSHEANMTSFLGQCGHLASPEAVRKGKLSNSGTTEVIGEYICGSLAKNYTIPAGKSVTFHVLVGVSQKEGDAGALKKKYLAPGRIEKEFAALRSMHAGYNSCAVVKTPDEAFNQAANFTLKSSLMHVTKWTRGLDNGYRDILQDVMGTCNFWPEFTRKEVKRTLAYQYKSGVAMRQWSEIGGPHDQRKHRDSSSWIVWPIEQYLTLTGDYKFLQESVPYFDGGKASIWEHLLQGLRVYMKERGPHGICTIGDGDWNDAIDGLGKGRKGESIWLTCAAVVAAQKAIKIAEHIGDKKAIKELQNIITTLSKAVNKIGLKGGYYTYGIRRDGGRIGAPENKEGKIHLNVQTWAIFSDIATAKTKKNLQKMIDTKLETPFGPALVSPCYKTQDMEHIGRITGMTLGMFENGAVYTHGVAMTVRSDTHEGRGAWALKRWKKVIPCNPDHNPDVIWVEPYATTNFYMGPEAPIHGRALYSWHSGSTSWLYLLAHQHIVGFRPEHKGIVIDPCVDPKWKKFSGSWKARGSTFNMKVSNPQGLERGVKSVTINGQAVKGQLIAWPEKAGTYAIDVVMG